LTLRVCYHDITSANIVYYDASTGSTTWVPMSWASTDPTGQFDYWQGTISATHVVISGHVEGDIIANGRVEIANTARITGKVTGEAIAVAEGAVVEGQMKTTGQPEPVGFVEKRDRDDG
jgi:predicted acyltransferase (DUF342 family)